MRYANMILSVELVTPEIAAQWLGKSNTGNRRLRKSTAAQYARDMSSGDWLEKPVALCFDENDQLGNGQHTLTAIIASNTSQLLLIARGCTAEQIAVMDVGLKRTITDIAHFVGKDLGSREAAVARILTSSVSSRSQMSFAALYEAYSQHQEPIDWLCSICPKAPGFSAPALAVLVRAWYSKDRGRIAEFVDVVRTGEIKSSVDTAAIRYRDYCRTMRTVSSMSTAIEVYRRLESALDCFLRHKPMGKLYGTEKELFPLPESV